MSQFFEVHPDNPQPRLLKQAVQLLERGGVLAVHGFLNGKTATTNPSIRQSPSIRPLPIKWSDSPVETDGRVVTASAPEHAAAFADALLKAMAE